jgi:hypothetical protein
MRIEGDKTPPVYLHDNYAYTEWIREGWPVEKGIKMKKLGIKFRVIIIDS